MLEDTGNAWVGFANYKFLASYSWYDPAKPTILVPGCPPRWNPPTPHPIKVSKDSGPQFIDQNAHRCLQSPYAPFFEPLLILHLKFDMTQVSLITDRNSLRKLLAFASGNTGDPFRIGVEVVGDTLVLIRREKASIRSIGKHDNKGYGHEFEKPFSTFDKGSREGAIAIIELCSMT